MPTPTDPTDTAGERPTILVLPFDLARVLDGHPMTVTDDQDREYVLRLFTAQEFLTAQHAAVDMVGQGASKISIERARELTGDLS